jgi:hypothetical protein
MNSLMALSISIVKTDLYSHRVVARLVLLFCKMRDYYVGKFTGDPNFCL